MAQKLELMPPHYRHILGGLDNAVRQAEARHFHDMLIVDADFHATEPFDELAEYLDEECKELIRNSKDEPDDFFTLPGDRKNDVEVERQQRTESTYPKAMSTDHIVDILTQRWHDIGIKYSLLLPNQMLRLPMEARNPALEVKVGKAWNEYLVDKFLGKYPDIIGGIYVPSTSPDRAAEMIDDYGSEKGMKCVWTPSETPTRPGGEDWNAIWEAAEKKNLPVCVHAAIPKIGKGDPASRWFDFGMGKGKFMHGDLPKRVISFPFSIIRFMSSLLAEGVPERFPKLKWLFIEPGVTFIPWIMQRWDQYYLESVDKAPLLKKLPSEYINDWFYTTQPLEINNTKRLEGFCKMWDSENKLIYASDFPHTNFDVPSTVYDLPFYSEEAKRKILGGNAAKFFNL
jgi:uncharacterized protein